MKDLDKYISLYGYERNSVDRNRPFNVIPSGRISMKNVDFPVLGIDNMGNSQIMYPGKEYQFGGSSVLEIPMNSRNNRQKLMQYGGNLLMPITAQNVSDFLSVFSVPQKAVTKLVTGKYQTPSEAMGIENPVGSFVVDALLDPVNLVGAGVLGKAAKASTQSGVLSNAYKYNPWAFKPNPEAYYRGIGRSGLDDAIQTGTLRTGNKTGNYGEDLYMTNDYRVARDTYSTDRPTMQLNPQKSTPDNPWGTEYIPAKDPKSYIAEIPKNEAKNIEKVDEYIFRNKGALPTENIRFFKEDWLRGYKQVPLKESGGQHGGLDRWFAEKWVDVKTGKECGRQEGEKRKGYPACRPSKRVSTDTPKTASELSSAEKARFKREKTSSKRISYNHKKEEGGELELAQYGYMMPPAGFNLMLGASELYNYFFGDEPKEVSKPQQVKNVSPMGSMYQLYNADLNQFKSQRTSNDKLTQNNPGSINLSSGRFQGAQVSPEVIKEAVASAKAQGIDPWLMLSVIGRESTFGSGTDANIKRAGSKSKLVSGWDVAENYTPYDPLRFLADKKVPGVSTTRDVHGWHYKLDDKAALNKYLSQHPELVAQYKKKIESTPELGNLDSFDLAAKFIKERGLARYNPGDPNYSSMVNQDMKLLQSDPKLKAYMKTLGYENGGELSDMKSGGNVPTNPSLWSRAKAAAKAKYDVYPSAYANGFAAKWYKQRGGSWKKAAEGGCFECGGQLEDGGQPEVNSLSPQDLNNWNEFVKYAKRSGAASDERYNHDKKLGYELIKKYNQENPNSSIDKNRVKDYQSYFLNMAAGNTDSGQLGVRTANSFKNGISRVDGFIGLKTLNQMVPKVSTDINGVRTDYGSDFASANKNFASRENLRKYVSYDDATNEQRQAFDQGMLARKKQEVAAQVRKPIASDNPQNYQEFIASGQSWAPAPEGGFYVKEMGGVNYNDMLNQPVFVPTNFYQFGGMSNPLKQIQNMDMKDKLQLAKLAMMFAEDGGEADGGMALTQVNAMIDRLNNLKNFITPESDLDPWVSDKISVMNHSATAINDYMQYGEQEEPEEMREGGIPERYKNMGFSKVGVKKNSTRPGKKWMVLAKKGDDYKVVHGGYDGMKDYTQHGSEKRRDRFWDRMGGKDSDKAKDPFSPLYWHKRFGTWAEGGEPQNEGFQSLPEEVQDKILKRMIGGGEEGDWTKTKTVTNRNIAAYQDKPTRTMVNFGANTTLNPSLYAIEGMDDKGFFGDLAAIALGAGAINNVALGYRKLFGPASKNVTETNTKTGETRTTDVVQQRKDQKELMNQWKQPGMYQEPIQEELRRKQQMQLSVPPMGVDYIPAGSTDFSNMAKYGGYYMQKFDVGGEPMLTKDEWMAQNGRGLMGQELQDEKDYQAYVESWKLANSQQQAAPAQQQTGTTGQTNTAAAPTVKTRSMELDPEGQALAYGTISAISTIANRKNRKDTLKEYEANLQKYGNTDFRFDNNYVNRDMFGQYTTNRAQGQNFIANKTTYAQDQGNQFNYGFGPGFEEGGEYDLTPQQIAAIMAAGGEIEFLD